MKPQIRNTIFNYLTIIVILIGLFFFYRLYQQGNIVLDTYSYVGIFLLIPSIILFIIARIQLGSSFQASAEANKLVKSGIYKKISHPIYLFGLILMLSMILISHLFFLIPVLAIIIVIQRKRIVNEENVLAEKFGDEYLEYKKQTWF